MKTLQSQRSARPVAPAPGQAPTDAPTGQPGGKGGKEALWDTSGPQGVHFAFPFCGWIENVSCGDTFYEKTQQ
jgi:hypothetical protein